MEGAGDRRGRSEEEAAAIGPSEGEWCQEGVGR